MVWATYDVSRQALWIRRWRCWSHFSLSLSSLCCFLLLFSWDLFRWRMTYLLPFSMLWSLRFLSSPFFFGPWKRLVLAKISGRGRTLYICLLIPGFSNIAVAGSLLCTFSSQHFMYSKGQILDRPWANSQLRRLPSWVLVLLPLGFELMPAFHLFDCKASNRMTI